MFFSVTPGFSRNAACAVCTLRNTHTGAIPNKYKCFLSFSPRNIEILKLPSDKNIFTSLPQSPYFANIKDWLPMKPPKQSVNNTNPTSFFITVVKENLFNGVPLFIRGHSFLGNFQLDVSVGTLMGPSGSPWSEWSPNVARNETLEFWRKSYSNKCFLISPRNVKTKK